MVRLLAVIWFRDDLQCRFTFGSGRLGSTESVGAQSDVNDFYQLSNLPAGTVQLSLNAEGRAPLSATFELAEGQLLRYDFNLAEGGQADQ